ncbi:MAG: TRAP transporter large permease [Burkholderiaceae bacterium]
MSPLEIAGISVAALTAALVIGVPVAAAMGVVGLLGMWLTVGPAFTMAQLQTLPFAVVGNYDFAVLPLFVLMGAMAEASGITAQLFGALRTWLGRWRGGLYQAVVAASAMFAAISGSTIVNAVVFTRVALPEMLRHGYDRNLSIGCIAATGSFAAMIPPSITIVIYAIMTEQSVGRLLIAGIVPGVLTALVYALGLHMLVRWRPALAPPIRERPAPGERLRAARVLIPVLALAVPLFVGLYAGLYPASAAGAVGAFAAFALALWRRGARGWLGRALGDSAAIACTLFAVLIGGLLLSRMLVISGVIDELVTLVTDLAGSPARFMVIACLFYLLLGCFLDTTSMMVVTLPFVYPVVQSLNIDPIWFGVVLVKLIEISVITPPVGVNLFAVMSAAEGRVSFGQVVRGVLPLIALEGVVLSLLVAFPSLATWLPERMLGQ